MIGTRHFLTDRTAIYRDPIVMKIWDKSDNVGGCIMSANRGENPFPLGVSPQV